jgi:hypothetical protein
MDGFIKRYQIDDAGLREADEPKFAELGQFATRRL